MAPTGHIITSATLDTWLYYPKLLSCRKVNNKYQLTREQRSGGNSFDITYTYDGVGNRTKKLSEGVTTTYTYDGANQLLTEVDDTNTTTYTYDENGNVTKKRLFDGASTEITSYTWDYEDRLTKVELPSGTLNTFTYNGDGQRVQKEDSDGTRKFVWDEERSCWRPTVRT